MAMTGNSGFTDTKDAVHDLVCAGAPVPAQAVVTQWRTSHGSVTEYHYHDSLCHLEFPC